MNVIELLEAVGAKDFIANGSLLLFIVISLLQISPVKINPWSWIAKQVGRAINSEVIHKVGNLENELVKLRNDVEGESVVTCRARILRFGDELLHDVHHSKDLFDQTLRDIDKYEQYCEKHKDFKNSITTMTIQRIKEVYNELLTNGGFL